MTMLDPSGFYSEYLAGIATDLTLRVLNSVGRRLRETIEGTPRQQALVRCYQAGAAAMLPKDDPAHKAYLPILRDFLDQPAVDAELAKLIKGRQPDQETLVEAFEEACYNVDNLPSFDFPARLADCVEAFLETAEQESELADIIQTAQLRDVATNLRSLAEDVSAIRQVVEKGEGPRLRLVLYWESGGGYVPVPPDDTLNLKAINLGTYTHCLFGLAIANHGDEIGKDVRLILRIDNAAPCTIKLQEAFVPTRPSPFKNWEQGFVGFSWQLGQDFACHPQASPAYLARMQLIIPKTETGKIQTTQFGYELYANGMEPVFDAIPAVIIWT